VSLNADAEAMPTAEGGGTKEKIKSWEGREK
jgi:hypothetical protein